MGPHIERKPFFLGSLIALYARSEKITEDQLADLLGCPKHEWTMLKLCRVPREGRELEQADLQQIADGYKVSLSVLTRVVRRGRILQRMSAPVTADVSDAAAPGILMAAREADPPKKEENP